jgi:transketolase
MRKACLDMVYELAKRDERVVFIGSDLGPGLLDEMKTKMPERWFMEGVSEQNMIGMAAGLAMEGYIPYVNTIATFLTRRCYEQVALDLCLHNLPVRLIGNGGGLVYAPLGPTHLAIEDMAIMRALPNMTVVAPTDADEMRRFMATTPDHAGPIYVRLGKGGDEIVSRDTDGFQIGKAILLRDAGEVLIVATGVMVNPALAAAEAIAENGIGCGVLNMHTVKPLDTAQLLDLASKVRLVVTVEEHTLPGGLGSAIAETLADHPEVFHPAILRLGIPDTFAAEYGSQDSLLETYGLQPDRIASTIKASYLSLEND